MMSLWRKRILWTIFFAVTASAGVCVAQEPVDLAPESTRELPEHDQPPQEAGPPTPSSFHQPAPVLPAPSAAQAFAAEGTISLPSESEVADTLSTGTATVQVRYVIERPVVETTRQNGKIIQVTRYVREAQSAQIPIDANLDELDLPPDGKRAAVLAVTAARHEDLLQKLKAAEDDEEKTKEAAEALKTNYTEHYAIETWWREQRLAELEERLKEMRDQVEQRQAAQEKYVEAAMTIAELWAQGIAIAPPKPGSAPEHGPRALPAPAATLAPTAGAVWSPATHTEYHSPTTLPQRFTPSPEPLTPVYDTPTNSRK